MRWIKRKDRLRVILEILPQIHSHSSSSAHTLSVTVTSTLPFYSSAWLWRRSVLLSFIHCHVISIFLGGHCALSWNFCGGRGDGRGGGGSTMFGFIRAHQISDHAEIVIRHHMRAKLYRWNYVIYKGNWAKNMIQEFFSNYYDSLSNYKNNTVLLF